MVSDAHTIFSGSGLHISVPSHVNIIIGDTYPATHQMVTVETGNLLETGPKAPFMGFVKTGQPSERESLIIFLLINEVVNLPILKLYSAVVLLPAQLVATILTV